MMKRHDANKTNAPQPIVASELTIVDADGARRIRLHVVDGTPSVELFDKESRLRVALYLKQDEGEDMAGLLITDSNRRTAVRLDVGRDGLMQKRGRLEIVEFQGGTRKIHTFPPRPRGSDD